MDYHGFRREALGLEADALHEGTIPESLVQSIWQHQRIHRDRARSIDDTPITILHPGFLNHEAGPDFKGGIIRFGDASPVEGDIEIDLTTAGWRAHGHDRNPSFNNVILRVVWEQPTGDHTGPVLYLRPLLDAPIRELAEWLPNAGPPQTDSGNCCAALRSLDREGLEKILEEAALVRLESKTAAFSAGRRNGDPASLLWPRLFASLGYKNNPWPMFRIGELADELRSDNPLVTQARVLGLSGLLPRELPESCRSSREYVRDVWNEWWRQCESFHPHAIPASAWKLGGIRPANHPLRRMALAAHWLQLDESLPARIRRWSTRDIPTSMLESELLEILSPVAGSDSYWENHWNFTSQPMSRPQPLLGRQRLTDVAVNVMLPWLLAGTKDQNAKKRVRAIYLDWPAGESNSRLRMAANRLFGGEKRKLKRTAAIQQGLLQIESDFCNRSNALCEGCRFPDFVGTRDGGRNQA